jgi:hypothetical protein
LPLATASHSVDVAAQEGFGFALWLTAVNFFDQC